MEPEFSHLVGDEGRRVDDNNKPVGFLKSGAMREEEEGGVIGVI